MMQRLLFNLGILVLLLAGGSLYAQDSDGGNADSARDADSAGNADSGKGKEKSEDAGKKIYKVQEEDGSVTFTDEPPKDRDSEEVELQKGNSMRMEATPGASLPEPEEEKDEIAYELKVTSPKNDGVLRHPTEPVPVQYNVKPPLKSGHKVQLLHNGEVLEGEALEWPIRGQHQVSVRVVDTEGNVVSKSEPNTFFVHRPSKQLPYGP
jgi:hypothetical protein